MANNNLEKYLEAILDKIADGTETDIPRPSWNIEKYLAAIYEALSSGGGGGSGGAGCSCNIVVATENTVTGALDKTWQEIRDADIAIIRIRVIDTQNNDKEFNYIAHTVETSDASFVVLYDFGRGDGTFRTDSANGYPVRVNGGSDDPVV